MLSRLFAALLILIIHSTWPKFNKKIRNDLDSSKLLHLGINEKESRPSGINNVDYLAGILLDRVKYPLKEGRRVLKMFMYTLPCHG